MHIVDLVVIGISGSGRNSVVSSAFRPGDSSVTVHLLTTLCAEKQTQQKIAIPHCDCVWYIVDATRSRLLPY